MLEHKNNVMHGSTNMGTRRQTLKTMAKRDVAKNDQQGKRTSWIQDMEGAVVASKDRVVGGDGSMPHSPRGEKDDFDDNDGCSNGTVQYFVK